MVLSANAWLRHRSSEQVGLFEIIRLLMLPARQSILGDQTPVTMRVGTGLSRVDFAPLARPRATSRATDSLYLSESRFLAHLGLLFRDNGHRSTLQERDDQCAIYLQTTVVADEALLPEPSHKMTYPRSGRTNHLRQG